MTTKILASVIRPATVYVVKGNVQKRIGSIEHYEGGRGSTVVGRTTINIWLSPLPNSKKKRLLRTKQTTLLIKYPDGTNHKISGIVYSFIGAKLEFGITSRPEIS